ncbi:MAG: substrate-binding domain-containing protein [Thermodesulfovibrio sp.]|uniref:substrate-binding domain-containing protein n=1 Tax=unclassified Thermodesulfovibrio TaxID=2645936 RepID=UPI00083A8C9B|nr:MULTISPECIES: substrate-binding domain-containing protein [unclassified Thermodesulfovibrio]MDI1471878.1 substrate-binding domain-containing protein [Thermodesulfovibrio sp. 1176]MDI6714949.1 substrate-binding domain-containing protein [Thermodesulfovibrio sp.]ODA44796.1 ABC-type tungstate transport system, periplasmic binding protein [Thermodesulfovibrio sp. N1]
MKILLAIVFSLFILANAAVAQQNVIVLATTTSVENSGLLSHILPLFEKKTGIKVKVIARGTGAAIEMGKRGDADVVFAHAKELELEALKKGYFINRHDVCYNDFIIVGPKNDPAKIKEIKKSVDAFKRIALSQSFFISRGDKSGTHMKELSLWQRAKIEPKGQKWYLEAGQGMEKTLRIANEKQAYTLTDRGTWLAIKDKHDLTILFQGDPFLFNQYGVMAVNPQKHKHVKYKEAMEFVNWIISKEGQNAIASFKDKFGNQLFIPNAR